MIATIYGVLAFLAMFSVVIVIGLFIVNLIFISIWGNKDE